MKLNTAQGMDIDNALRAPASPLRPARGPATAASAAPTAPADAAVTTGGDPAGDPGSFAQAMAQANQSPAPAAQRSGPAATAPRTPANPASNPASASEATPQATGGADAGGGSAVGVPAGDPASKGFARTNGKTATAPGSASAGQSTPTAAANAASGPATVLALADAKRAALAADASYAPSPAATTRTPGKQDVAAEGTATGSTATAAGSTDPTAAALSAAAAAASLLAGTGAPAATAAPRAGGSADTAAETATSLAATPGARTGSAAAARAALAAGQNTDDTAPAANAAALATGKDLAALGGAGTGAERAEASAKAGTPVRGAGADGAHAAPTGSAPATADNALDKGGRFAEMLAGSLGTVHGAGNTPLAASGLNAATSTPDAALASVTGGGQTDGNPALAAAQAAAGIAPGASAAPAVVHIATAVGDSGFGQEVSQQLVSLTKTGAQSAQLSLNPEHMGPVSVTIQMNGLEATVSISASHEATRTALREALPQLDALFAQGGLQLGGAHVGDGSERQAGRQAGPGDRNGGFFGPGTGAEPASAVIVPAAIPGTRSTRLIDTFA